MREYKNLVGVMRALAWPHLKIFLCHRKPHSTSLNDAPQPFFNVPFPCVDSYGCEGGYRFSSLKEADLHAGISSFRGYTVSRCGCLGSTENVLQCMFNRLRYLQTPEQRMYEHMVVHKRDFGLSLFGCEYSSAGEMTCKQKGT